MAVQLSFSLEDIAADIHETWAKSKAHQIAAWEGYFRIGADLLEARRRFPSDPKFGAWVKQQEFEFKTEWARRLRLLAEHEPDARRLLATGVASSVAELVEQLSGRPSRDAKAAEKRKQRDAATRAAIASDLRKEAREGSLTVALDDLIGKVDAIITDPPYPRKFLPLFGDLAALADRLLKPDGVLAVMVGQPHLPTVFRLLEGGRPYRWTVAYLTPGPDGIVHGRARVASAWKPVILYGGGRHLRDIVTSGGDDKSAHHWQQDLDGFTRLVDILTEPGHLVVDPFMGSGTTLLAALSLGRHAIGCDIDPKAVASARERLGL